ncbi:PopZ family protein [Microvirga lenta]|uniref:PopZ family protein n=1 Tax=Microvirga lenta TaxID=2881337 RepID=UPI001CFFB0E4|nr:DUF2497 domain-containing protein [Microvirga lenta]MCB5176746.1 DUF2497 domain-containing protein [Microvirga lenta]
MEEILASIRRIIADDQETLQIVQPGASSSEGSPLRNVLDLTEHQVSAEMLPILPDPELEPPVFTAFDEDEDDEMGDDAPVMDFPSVAKVEQPAPQPRVSSAKAPIIPAPAIEAEEPLLSSKADASVADAFMRLDSTVAQNAPKTLEDLAKEMLRPMLKTWLDDNLPPLVERLVQAEIERVTRSRR